MMASRVLCVRPVSFSFNAQAGTDNAFMHSQPVAREAVLAEHDRWMALLREHGIDVVLFEHEDERTPDAGCVLWAPARSSADGSAPQCSPTTGSPSARVLAAPAAMPPVLIMSPGRLCLFPMKSPNRRLERRPDMIE